MNKAEQNVEEKVIFLPDEQTNKGFLVRQNQNCYQLDIDLIHRLSYSFPFTPHYTIDHNKYILHKYPEENYISLKTLLQQKLSPQNERRQIRFTRSQVLQLLLKLAQLQNEMQEGKVYHGNLSLENIYLFSGKYRISNNLICNPKLDYEIKLSNFAQLVESNTVEDSKMFKVIFQEVFSMFRQAISKEKQLDETYKAIIQDVRSQIIEQLKEGKNASQLLEVLTNIQKKNVCQIHSKIQYFIHTKICSSNYIQTYKEDECKQYIISEAENQIIEGMKVRNLEKIQMILLKDCMEEKLQKEKQLLLNTKLYSKAIPIVMSLSIEGYQDDTQALEENVQSRFANLSEYLLTHLSIFDLIPPILQEIFLNTFQKEINGLQVYFKSNIKEDIQKLILENSQPINDLFFNNFQKLAFGYFSKDDNKDEGITQKEKMQESSRFFYQIHFEENQHAYATLKTSILNQFIDQKVEQFSQTVEDQYR